MRRSTSVRPLLLATLLLASLGSGAGNAAVLETSAADDVARIAARALGAPANSLWRLSDLEVPGHGAANLVLERFELFTPDLRYLVDGRERPVPADLRAMTFWRGVVEGMPGSGAFLRVAPGGSTEGVLRLGEARYTVAPDSDRRLAATVDFTAALEASAPACGAGATLVRPERGGRPFAEAAIGAAAKAPKKPVPAPPGPFIAPIAVETDQQLLANYFGDVGLLHGFLGTLFGEISAVTDRELALAIAVNLISVWTNDPWSDTDNGLTLLVELRNWWNKNRPYAKFPRSAVHLVAGRRLDVGGIAYVYGACDGIFKDAFDYGLSRSNALTIAHELGHNFGSFHTHCYSPPVDQCYAQQEDCYAGPVVEPPDGGSLMSYCGDRNASFGEPGKYGTNSERVPAVLREFIDTIYPGCLLRRTDPFELTVAAVTANSASLTWQDIFDGEKNYVVEVKNKTTFKTVKTLAAGATGVNITSLKKGQTYIYRVYAKFKGNNSEKSFEVTVGPL